MPSVNEQVLEEIRKNKKYKTSDIYEAAYYMTMKCVLKDKELEHDRLLFCFEGDNLEEVVGKWLRWQDPATSVRKYSQNVQTLRQDISKYLDSKRAGGNPPKKY